MNKEQQVLEAIAAELETLPGHLGFYYKNLATGREFGIRQEEPFLAASVIKLPLFLHVLKAAAEGRISLEDKLTVSQEAKMPSCGALTLFTGPVEADLLTLCRLMIALSDNTATNVLIDHWGIEAVNETFRALGLKQTVLRRLLFDAGAASRGLENTVSPREMGMLLEKIYHGSFVSPETSRLALDTLLLQQIGHKLDGRLQGEVDIAHKTGEDTNLSNDVGLILAKEPFLLCFTGHDTDVYPWEDLMRRAAWELVHCQEGEDVMETKTYIAPNATVMGDVRLGNNANIWYGAVLRGDNGPITIGEGTNVQDNAVIHDQTTLGKNCTVGHGAIVHGCTAGDDCLIGMGAIVLSGAELGDGCLVGAGALVTGKTKAPAGSVLLGSPAKIVKTLTAEEISHNRENALHYVNLAKKSFRKSPEAMKALL